MYAHRIQISWIERFARLSLGSAAFEIPNHQHRCTVYAPVVQYHRVAHGNPMIYTMLPDDA